MNKRAAFLFLLTAVAGCNRQPAGQSSPAEQAPLAGARIGGPFALVDQDGRPVSEKSWPGKWRAMYFGYTFCPDVCPVDLQKLMQGYRLFARDHPAEAAKLQPIFVTVDPARDTPAAIRQYVGAFGAPLIGLTGSAAQVAAAAKAFSVYYARQDVPGSSDYLMDHQRTTYLLDPDGKPIALLPTDADAPAVAAELARWVR